MASDPKTEQLLQPRWKLWALLAVLVGCLVTLAATINDIF